MKRDTDSEMFSGYLRGDEGEEAEQKVRDMGKGAPDIDCNTENQNKHVVRPNIKLIAYFSNWTFCGNVSRFSL